jgi:RNA polymerase sigma-70 factor (ECF subfamily)
MWRARLDRLPVRYRRAVELRHVEGLSYPELSAALGRPLGTVKSDVHRGVRALREAVERESGGDPRTEVSR